MNESGDRCYYCKRKIEGDMEILGEKLFKVVGKKMCKTCFYFFSYTLKADCNGWQNINKIWNAWINKKKKVRLPSLSMQTIKWLENKVGFKVKYSGMSSGHPKNCIVYLTKSKK